VPEKSALKALKALEKKGVEAWAVGRMYRGKPGVDVV
jgi:hypothetical protein